MGNKDNNSNEKLDAVLTILNDASKTEIAHPQTFFAKMEACEIKATEIYNELIKNKIKNIELHELTDILSFLNEEKYASSSNEFQPDTLKIPIPIVSKITYRGKVFIENNGYIGKANKDIEESKKIADLSKNMENLTRWLAIGTVGLLIFEIIKFCLEHYCHSY